MQSNAHTDYTTYTDANAHHHHCKSTISWGAIFAGVIIALSLQSLFHLLGLALGFSVFTPDANTATHLGIGSLVWLAITGIISMFVGGWVAGRTAGFGLHKSGTLQGLIAWGLATLIVLLLTASAVGALVSAGAATVINKDISLTVKTAGTNAVNTTNTTNPQVTNVNQATAQDIENASDTLGSVAFATFIMFLLGAIAGAIGGSLGYRRVREDHVTTTHTVNTSKV